MINNNNKLLNSLLFLGVCLAAVLCSLAIPSPAFAVTVTVQMDGTNQILKDQNGSSMPTGCVIQIIYSAGDTIHPPTVNGEATGGDSIIWTGTVGEGGMGSGAFNKTFAGGQSLTDGSWIYVRAWNNSSIASADRYGNSQLSTTLEAGDPPMPITWSVPTFETLTTFKAGQSFYTTKVGSNEEWGWNNAHPGDNVPSGVPHEWQWTTWEYGSGRTVPSGEVHDWQWGNE